MLLSRFPASVYVFPDPAQQRRCDLLRPNVAAHMKPVIKVKQLLLMAEAIPLDDRSCWA